jgi:death-on-curing protein
LIEETESLTETVGQLIAQVYSIHETVIAESGGMEGLRDGAMLHAAIARPFVTFAGVDLYSDDFEKAAALFHSLIKSHPFLDGTKRTAFLAAIYFLENRGYTIPEYLPKDEIIRFCLAVAEENMRLAAGEPVQPKGIPEIADWFRRLLGPGTS